MKKLAILTAVGMVSCLSSFGQGYLIFNNSAGTTVKDNFSFGYSTNSPGTIFAGLLWHVGASNTLPLLGTTATSSNSVPNWAAVLGSFGQGWGFATNSTSGLLLGALTRVGAPTTGTFSGGAVPLGGSQPGDVISMYVIGWQASFGGNVLGAAAANSALGWSNPMTYTMGSSGSPGVAMNNAGMTSFTANQVPEPATFALAGLGAAALLILRRRK